MWLICLKPQMDQSAGLGWNLSLLPPAGCPEAAAAPALQEGCGVSLPGLPAPPCFKETECPVQPQPVGSLVGPRPPGPLQTQSAAETPPPLPFARGLGLRDLRLGEVGLEDGPSPSRKMQPSQGSLLGSGTGRNRKKWPSLSGCGVGATPPKGKSRPQQAHRTEAATPVQPGFRPAPAWRRLEALIMFAGCLQYKPRCPESP